MTNFVGECSLMKQISRTEEAIKVCYERLELLEKKADSDNVSDNKKQTIRRELEEVRKLLVTNEDQLSHLHKHNRTSFAFVAALCFVCFTVYALYVLVQGKDF